MTTLESQSPLSASPSTPEATLSRLLPTSSKRPRSPHNDTLPPPKTLKPQNYTFQLSLDDIVRLFSSFIHVPIYRRLPIQYILVNLRKLHINAHRILDIQYSDRNVTSLLIHTGFETELRSQLRKYKIVVRDNFDSLDLSITHDPDFINESIERKTHIARNVFLSRLATAFHRLKTPVYNAVVNYFIQSGFIGLNFLTSFDLVLSYNHQI